MGRRPNRIDYTTLPNRGALAAMLRNQRRRTGLTFQELATKAGLSAATLKRAASGKVVPTERTVVAFIEACDGGKIDVENGRMFWQLARVEERGTLQRHLHIPHPRFMSSQAELSLGLVALHERDGLPSFHEMQRRAGAEWLAISSISRIVHREALPVSRGQMTAFLQACRVSDKAKHDWLDTWERVVNRPYARTIYPVPDGLRRRPSPQVVRWRPSRRQPESQNDVAVMTAASIASTDGVAELIPAGRSGHEEVSGRR